MKKIMLIFISALVAFAFTSCHCEREHEHEHTNDYTPHEDR